MELIDAIAAYSNSILNTPFRIIRQSYTDKFTYLIREYFDLQYKSFPNSSVGRFIEKQKFFEFTGDHMNIKDVEKYIETIMERIKNNDIEIKQMLCYVFNIEYNDKM